MDQKTKQRAAVIAAKCGRVLSHEDTVSSTHRLESNHLKRSGNSSADILPVRGGTNSEAVEKEMMDAFRRQARTYAYRNLRGFEKNLLQRYFKSNELASSKRVMTEMRHALHALVALFCFKAMPPDSTDPYKLAAAAVVVEAVGRFSGECSIRTMKQVGWALERKYFTDVEVYAFGPYLVNELLTTEEWLYKHGIKSNSKPVRRHGRY